MHRSELLSRFVVVLLAATLLLSPTGSLAQTPQCTRDAAFVADVTVPDNTEFAAGASFDKTWTLKNSGTCEWTEDFSLAYSRGDRLSDSASQPLGRVVRPGETANITVPMTAPVTPGTYSGNWRMKDQAGRPFGMEVYVRIVSQGAPAVPTMPAATGILVTPTLTLALPAPKPALSPRLPIRLSGRQVHYELYLCDGYVNTTAGVWPPTNDPSVIPGWPTPLYIWGVTDVDPNSQSDQTRVPARAGATEGSPVGNAHYPAPFLEATEGDDVYLTVHNRGFRQEKQSIQPDQALQLIGVPTAAQYAGVPETAGGYSETMRCFWQEPWYLALGGNTTARDAKWNNLPTPEQQALLEANAALIRTNALSPAGGVRSPLNKAEWPVGVGSLTDATAEEATQFTYHFRAGQSGTYLYRSHSAGAGRVALGAAGALIIRPSEFSFTATTAYGAHTGSDYDREMTLLLSEIDPALNTSIESGQTPGVTVFSPALWLINGRSFPQTLSPFAWNASAREARYDSTAKLKLDQTLLVRCLNAGAEVHTLRQSGGPMHLIGTNGQPSVEPRDTQTLAINPGETVDVLIAAKAPAVDGRGWRQIWSLGEQDDMRLTTAGVYPGGMLTFIEFITDTTPAGAPTWSNPYLSTPRAVPLQ